MRLSDITDVLSELRGGGKVVLVRDETHVADGYLLSSAETVTADSFAFMLRHGPGVVGLALTPERLDALGIAPALFDQNTSPFSAAEGLQLEFPATLARDAGAQASLLRALAQSPSGGDEPAIPEGTVPVRAALGGVLACPTLVEASVDLARLAGLKPVGLVCRLAARPGNGGPIRVDAFAEQHGLKVIGLASLVAHCRKQAAGKLIRLPDPVRLPTRYGVFQALVYEEPMTGLHHLSLARGDVTDGRPVLTRVHSECLTGDVLGSLRCDCGLQLDAALKQIVDSGHGVLLYLRQEGRGIGLYNKLRTYTLQEQGLDTVEANERLGFPPDLRDYGIAAQILRHLGIRDIRLLTNNPRKIQSLDDHGVRVVERVPLIVSSSPESSFYMRTKRDKLEHLLPPEESAQRTAPPPRRNSPERRTRFVILAAPRTGSNWLCTLLDSHPEILCHHEIFNPERILYSLPCRGKLDLGTLEDRERDPLGFLDRVWRAALGYRVLGFKLNRGQNEAVFRKVLPDPDVLKIVIRRRNRIKTYVSERIAERTGEWESYPGLEIGKRRCNIDVDLEDLRRHIERNERYYEDIEAVLSSTGQTRLELTYEELETEEERRRLLDFLSVSPDVAVLKEATRKQNSPYLKDLIANFSELGARLHGTELESELNATGL